MLQPSSRVNIDQGIRFYEQDILYDDYIYTGDFDIALTLNYAVPGFGIGITNSESSHLSGKQDVLLFKMGQKSVDIIYRNKDTQKTLATFSSAFSKVYTENLKYILQKRKANYTLYVGEQKVCSFKAPVDFETYNVIYYSNKDNVIKNINVASSIPYGWVTNMQNTNGGYIWFYRDAFEFKYCQGEAEIEQPDIYLNYGKYYLKYEVEDENECDIIPYVFQSEDERLLDKRKNILNPIDNSFILDYSQKISLKFEGTKGKVKKIYITTQRDNQYFRTSPDKGDKVKIKGSEIKIALDKIKKAEWKAKIISVPGIDHINPIDYSIIKNAEYSYGLFDLDLAQGVYYNYLYENKKIIIKNLNGVIVKELNLTRDALSLYKNVNGIVTNFVIVDKNGNDTNIIVENTIKKYAPGAINSPIIVIDEKEQPLELSSSYRFYKKNDSIYYWFTNTEREFFDPARSIRLAGTPRKKGGTVIVYGIRKESYMNMQDILKIEKEGKDTIDYFANYYDIIQEGHNGSEGYVLDATNKTINFNNVVDLSDYKMIVVDYLKDNSYAINFRHEYNSYEIDISIEDDVKTNLIYSNANEAEEGITFINEYNYVNTKAVPSEDCYIVIGR